MPIFVARPDPSAATGFSLPVGWQTTKADPTVVDSWQPGDALCAVMGHGLDLVDVDPRNGGSLDAVPVPEVYGLATTPSAGVHAFVRSLNVRSRNNLVPGVDVKAGDNEGRGRGFAFIAPTVRLSKVTGERVPYVWQQEPRLPECPSCAQVHAWYPDRTDTIPGDHRCPWPDDHSGDRLADMIRVAHGQVPVIPAADVDSVSVPSVEKFLEVGPWVDVEKTLRGGRNDGVMRLAAALRGEGGWPVERALDYMRAVVWPGIDQSQAGHEFTVDEFEGIIRGVWERYPDGRAARLDEAVDSGAERPPALVGVGLLDAWIVDRIASSRLSGRFVWARGLGWLQWDGRRWAAVDGSIVVDDVRQWVQWLYSSAAAAGADSDLLKKIAGLGGKARLSGLVDLARGVAGVRCDVGEFDAHPDLLNCANGVVDLRTGALSAHDPALRLTKITDIDYVVGAESGDWKAALEAIPEEIREWWQIRIGQAATGHMTPDDLLIVQVGGGENGKALDVDTPMFTTRGWTTMGELSAGDHVYAPDGAATEVLSAYPVRIDRPCYRVTMTDGRSLVADAEHLWTVYDRRARMDVTLTTQEMLELGIVKRDRAGGREFRFALPQQFAVQSAPVGDLPIPPYLLGVWLGDGTRTAAQLTFGEQDADELCGYLTECGAKIVSRRLVTSTGGGKSVSVRINIEAGVRDGFESRARRLGVWGERRIPELYLTAGTGQRLALLQGLLDTDSYVSAGQGQVEWTTAHQRLADDMLMLLRSLGFTARCHASAATLNGREVGRRWRICFTPSSVDLVPFRLRRRIDRLRAGARHRPISVVSIQSVESRPVRCIRVAHPSALYLAGRGLVPTHNTTLMSAIRGALGEYYLLVSHRALLGSSDSVPTELMDFRGARLALLEETPEERRLAVTKLKALVGTPEITARRMRQDPVTFHASHSLFISTNYLPVVSETDHGTWRRLAAVRFPYRFRKGSETLSGALDRRGDPNLRSRLIEGADGQHEAILAWIVAGAVRWYQSGREMPELPARVEATTRDWRAGTDLVLGYVSERLTFDLSRHVTVRELADDMAEWLVQHGHRPWSAELIASRFGDHSEVAGHDVERKQIRRTAGLSRRPARPGFSTESDIPEKYWAWMGLKFVEDRTNGDGGEGVTPFAPTPLDGPPKEGSSSDVEKAVTSNVPSAPIQNQTTENQHYSEYQRSLEGLEIGWGTRDKDQLKDQIRQLPKVTKAEQRRRDKAAAAAAAAGETVLLPSLVTRDGTISPASAETLRLAAAQRFPALTVDVETTGYPVGHQDYALRTIQLGTAEWAVVLDATDPAQRVLATEMLAAADVLHAHSATADLVPLALEGIIDYEDAFRRMQDTVITAKLADPSSTGSDPALKKVSAVVLGDRAVSPSANEARANLFHLSGWLTDPEPTTPVERSGWAQVDSRCATMVRYAASDVLDTAPLADEIPKPPEVVWNRERLAQRMTARVTLRGLPLDASRVAELKAEHETLLAAATRTISAFGIANPGSDKQVGAKLIEMGASLPRTDTGKPSVARDALEPLKGSEGPLGDLVRARLDYKTHEKLLSGFLTPYSVQCERGDGRVRPTVYTLGADTGRMSCVRPNLQQVPRSGGIRSCITADPGHLLISADFSSVEVRVMAALSQDPMLMHALANGLDVHGMIARQVYGPDFTKAHRYSVKRGVFGWAYGGGIEALAKQIGVDELTMAAIVEALKELAPTYVRWADDLKMRVRGGLTQFPTYSGRVIHLDPRFPHKAPNYAVQGTARELLIDALIRWSDTTWGECTLLPVHDELVVMVPEGEAEDAVRELVRCMETELYGVRIVAEASEPSFTWRDAA